MARPMPREAPVTSATLPVRSKRGLFDKRFDGCKIVGAPERHRDGVALNLAHETSQDGAGANLNIRCDAFGRKAGDDGLPAHGR